MKAQTVNSLKRTNFNEVSYSKTVDMARLVDGHLPEYGFGKMAFEDLGDALNNFNWWKLADASDASLDDVRIIMDWY